MAEAFANRYGNDVLIATSAGLTPVPSVIPETVAIMNEVDIDISSHIPMHYEPLSVSYYDIVVNMSGFRLPGKPPKELIEWTVQDPFQHTPEVYRKVRSELQNQVMQLILRLRRTAKK